MFLFRKLMAFAGFAPRSPACLILCTFRLILSLSVHKLPNSPFDWTLK
jgi:hypothetical protein